MDLVNQRTPPHSQSPLPKHQELPPPQEPSLVAAVVEAAKHVDQDAQNQRPPKSLTQICRIISSLAQMVRLQLPSLTALLLQPLPQPTEARL